MSFTDIIGALCLVIFYIVSWGPIPALYKGLKEMSIQSIALSFLVMGVINLSIWTSFGIQLNDYAIKFGNLICLVEYNIYLWVFSYIKGYKLLIIASPIVSVILVQILLRVNITFLGILGLCTGCFFFISSLENSRDCLIRKDPNIINRLLATLLIINSVLWEIYGLLTHNFYVYFPNLIGIILWSLNLMLYYWCVGSIEDDFFIIKLMKYFLVKENSNEKLERINENQSKI